MILQEKDSHIQVRDPAGLTCQLQRWEILNDAEKKWNSMHDEIKSI
jgi:hypothetical protein